MELARDRVQWLFFHISEFKPFATRGVRFEVYTAVNMWLMLSMNVFHNGVLS
jgi:hypothetical protein